MPWGDGCSTLAGAGLQAEPEPIFQALERSGWIQKDVAGLLRVSRRKLIYRIQRLGITHPSWRRNR